MKKGGSDERVYIIYLFLSHLSLTTPATSNIMVYQEISNTAAVHTRGADEGSISDKGARTEQCKDISGGSGDQGTLVVILRCLHQDHPQMLQRPSATNVNVPLLETIDTGRCTGTGSGGLKHLADDVGGSRRPSIIEPNSVLRRASCVAYWLNLSQHDDINHDEV